MNKSTWENEMRESLSTAADFKVTAATNSVVSKVNQRTKGTEKITHCSWLKNACSFNKD